MRKDVKKYMMGLLRTGHCTEMGKALACKYCGTKFKKAEKEYNRLRKEKPELFQREEPEFKPSPKLRTMFEQLVERINKDKLYRRHLERSQYGTPEEQEREATLADSGYYKKHYEEGGNILKT